MRLVEELFNVLGVGLPLFEFNVPHYVRGDQSRHSCKRACSIHAGLLGAFIWHCPGSARPPLCHSTMHWKCTKVTFVYLIFFNSMFFQIELDYGRADALQIFPRFEKSG